MTAWYIHDTMISLSWYLAGHVLSWKSSTMLSSSW
jgi:hypothetical protein